MVKTYPNASDQYDEVLYVPREDIDTVTAPKYCSFCQEQITRAEGNRVRFIVGRSWPDGKTHNYSAHILGVEFTQ